MSDINIKNKKATFEYSIQKVYSAGIELKGTEVKSIRNGNVSINEAYCYFHNNELYIKNMYIKTYDNAFIDSNHDERRDRKLLLKRQELDKLKNHITIKGYAIIPLRLFSSKKNLIKIEIATAKGKKLYDKRKSIKEKDLNREKDRNINI